MEAADAHTAPAQASDSEIIIRLKNFMAFEVFL